MAKNTVVIRWVDEKGKHKKLEIPDKYFEINIGEGVLKVKRYDYLGIVVNSGCVMDIDILDSKTIKVVSDWNENKEKRDKDAEFAEWED